MPFLIVATKRLPLRPGRNVLGGDDAQAPTGQAKPFAVIEVGSGGAAWISTTRKDVAVSVNGARVGSDRIQLTHGARIDIGGRKLTFADENHREPGAQSARAGRSSPTGTSCPRPGTASSP